MENNWMRQKYTVLWLSLVFPGAGFLYQKKWFRGIRYGLVHLILLALCIYLAIKMIFFPANNTSGNKEDIQILIYLVVLLIGNWFGNIVSILRHN